VFSGTGGSAIGPFRAEITAPDPLRWTNRPDRVNRTEPLRIEWTGGVGLVRIGGQFARETSTGTPELTGFVCTARQVDGTFSVPVTILSQIPAGSRGGMYVSSEIVQPAATANSAVQVDGSRFRLLQSANAAVQVE
jgi:hypothetical protein